MRFAHLSDSHLGYRQFGLLEREEDFYNVFEKTIDKIIDLDVDFVIHSGDLFENSRPSTEALLAFQKALLRLNDENIPIYAIAGNHDSILRKGALPPQVLFRDLGLKLISQNKPYYTQGAVLICGVPFTPNSQKRALLSTYNTLSKLAEKAVKSILVSHQGIGKYMREGTAEIELDELPKNFDYYAMGHIHNCIEEDYGKGKLIYPGSMEIWKTSESNDNYRKYGKGFCLVDLSHDVPLVERVPIDLPREFYEEVIDYDRLDERIDAIKGKIQSLDNKPMLDLSVVGGDFDSADIYELIQESIGDDVLNLRPKFKPDKVLEGEVDIDPDKKLDPRSLLFSKVNENYKEEVGRLSIDLLDNLSIGRIDDAKIISDRFYKEHYYDESDDGSSGLDDYLDKNLDSSNIDDKKDSVNADSDKKDSANADSDNKESVNEDSDKKDSANADSKKDKSRKISLDDF